MSPLKRQRRLMPGFVRDALENRGLLGRYLARPDYHQNDYFRWITDAKRPETRQKRFDQMLEELERGRVYMKMVWRRR